MKKIVADNRLAHFMDSRIMHAMVAALVILNAIVIAAKTFYEPTDDIYNQLQQLDKVLLYIFMIEVGIRLFANRAIFFHSYWNIFDFIIIYGSLIPVSGSFAIFESMRALRLFYLIEISKKMRHILHGVYLAFPGIANVVLLLVIIFFTFSLVAANLFKHPDIEMFQNIGMSAHTMFQVLTGDDWSTITKSVTKIYPTAWIFFYCYFILMGFVLLNLFIGVVVGALQNAEEEIEAMHQQNAENKGDPVEEQLRAMQAELAIIKEHLVKAKLEEKKKLPSPRTKKLLANPKEPKS